MKPAPTERGRSKSVLIIDQHPLVREKIGQLLAGEIGLRVCAAVENRAGALQALRQFHPNLVIMGLSFQDTHGLELIKDIKLQSPETAVLVLTAYEEGVFAERALQAGAKGYITKNEPVDKIQMAIHCVLDGGMYVSKEMAARLVARLVKGGDPSSTFPVDLLANREIEIFELTGHGKATREIAGVLGISIKTVQTYQARIKKKLGFHTPFEIQQCAAHWVQGESASPLARPTRHRRNLALSCQVRPDNKILLRLTRPKTAESLEASPQ